jgi:hypothetical protein
MTTVSDIEKKQVLFLQVVFSLRLELKAVQFPTPVFRILYVVLNNHMYFKLYVSVLR